MPPLELTETDSAISICGENFSITFDRWRGAISAWEFEGESLVECGPRLNLWRAPTDNDVHVAKEWRAAGYDRLMHRVDGCTCSRLDDSSARIEVSSSLGAHSVATKFECTHVYTIFGSGDVIIETSVTPGAGLPNLPRAGLQMTLPGQFDRIAWYGRGPHESYVDRKESARVGVYSGTVWEQYVPYIMPQENGNKSDVRWAAITNARGAGLLAVGMPLLNVGAHHFTTADLTNAQHTYELKRRDATILSLDHLQAGLGSNSCGPGPLEKYLIPAEEMTFRIGLRAFSSDVISPMTLSRQRISHG